MTNVAPLPVPHVPAGAAPAQLQFGEMLRRAEVLAKTDLVPKPLQGKPEAIVVIGVWGAEHGVPLMTAIQEVHIIENRPSPSAQLRLALIRRAGHEVRWVETSPTRAVIQGRRREYRNDPSGWTTVEYTLEMARQAGLLDEWAERWVDRRKQTWVVGDDTGRRDVGEAPDWVRAAVDAGDVRSKDNWRKYPADMLRARAAAVLARMEFSDVMAALDAHDYTAEEYGIDVGQDLDEPVENTPPQENGDAEEVDDAVVVEDLAPEPETGPPQSTSPAPAEPPDHHAAADPASHPWPEQRPGDRDDVAALKQRIRTGMTTTGWAGLVPWLEACKIPASLDRISGPRVDAVHAELDRRGVAPTATSHTTDG